METTGMETTAGRRWAIEEIVDLDRYPIASPEPNAAQHLVQRCRAELRAQGACQLEGFMRPDAVQAVLADALASERLAHRTEATHNAYFVDDDPELPADHPRRLRVRSAKRATGWNRIGPRSPLRALYEWDGLTEFIRAALQLPALHRDADPVGACSVMLYDEAGELGWHFDNSEFAVTLMLQASEDGGSFEFVPRIRDAREERYGDVGAVLAGARGGVLSMNGAAGTLALFEGRYSIHRVTQVLGSRPRVNAVLAYAREPDHRLTELNRDLFYGRVE
jgi:hypothetical protein